MQTSDQINDIATALAKAQGEIKGAKKDANNPFFKSMYADLESVREAMREAFSKNGLSITQDLSFCEKGYTMAAMLMHSSGQWIKYGPMLIPVKDKENPQAVKSSVTYIRRTQLLSICNMSEADDDGEAATQAVRQGQQPQKQQVRNFAPQTKEQAQNINKPQY